MSLKRSIQVSESACLVEVALFSLPLVIANTSLVSLTRASENLRVRSRHLAKSDRKPAFRGITITMIAMPAQHKTETEGVQGSRHIQAAAKWEELSQPSSPFLCTCLYLRA
jgi:hypothetical protein